MHIDQHEEFPFKDETYRIIGACFEVYKEKGCGFLESVFQECLELELASQGIPFVVKPILQLEYKGRLLKSTFQPDLICFGSIIVELKAVSQICEEHRAQVLNYLAASRLSIALLVNFGHYPKLEFERLCNIRKAVLRGLRVDEGLPQNTRKDAESHPFLLRHSACSAGKSVFSPLKPSQIDSSLRA